MAIERNMRLRRPTVPRRWWISCYHRISFLFRRSESVSIKADGNIKAYGSDAECAKKIKKTVLTCYPVAAADVLRKVDLVGTGCKVAAVRTGKVGADHSPIGR